MLAGTSLHPVYGLKLGRWVGLKCLCFPLHILYAHVWLRGYSTALWNWWQEFESCLNSMLFPRHACCSACKRWACPYEGTLPLLPIWESELSAHPSQWRTFVWWVTGFSDVLWFVLASAFPWIVKRCFPIDMAPWIQTCVGNMTFGVGGLYCSGWARQMAVDVAPSFLALFSVQLWLFSQQRVAGEDFLFPKVHYCALQQNMLSCGSWGVCLCLYC